MEAGNDSKARILVLAPTGRDAQLLADTLIAAKLATVVCPDFDTLLRLLDEGAAAAIISEEGLTRTALSRLSGWLASQPPWSDMPFVVLTFGGRPSPATTHRAQALEVLGNVTLLERPVRPDTVGSSMRAALRARKRQYEMRGHQEKLTRVNRDLEQFAYSASHDLREPLRTVGIYSQLISERYADKLDEQGQVFLGYLKSAASRMEMLVEDLLAFSQAAGITDEAVDAVSASEQLGIALANLAAAIKNSEACVTSDPLPSIKMKPVHLQQLFQNLVGNAVKYRAEAPLRIHISAQRQAGFWRFSVADNGIGIEREFHEQIFGIFKRLHTQDKFSGTGIGLAICQRIAERYGGLIWVESEPGKGSTFFFTVPASG